MPPDEPPLENLSRRESEILALLATDATNQEIAAHLVLALSSVKWYIQEIYTKLGVHDRRTAVRRARELGLLPTAQPVQTAVGLAAPEAALAPPRPTGIVTFLFTDIEGSTALWDKYPQEMPHNFTRHEAILRQTFAAHNGYAYKMVGDAFQVAFSTVTDAILSAVSAQRQLQAQDWGKAAIWVRMALHTCATEERGDDYIGPELNRLARLLACGHGGQVLLSNATRALAWANLPAGVSLIDAGEHRLKDLTAPEHIYQLGAPGLRVDFPPLRSQDLAPHNFRRRQSLFIGRQAEIGEVKALLLDQSQKARLVTLLGPGGVGKTRLSMQIASDLIPFFSDGVYFIDLAAANSCDQLLLELARQLEFPFMNGATRAISPDEMIRQLTNFLSAKKILLVLDNFEQLVQHAILLADLLEAGPAVRLLVTSRERLNLAEEWVVEVTGLPFPTVAGAEAIEDFPAVQLFLQCAQRNGLPRLVDSDWPAVGHICQMLAGMPLALEMAATWAKLLPVGQIAQEIEKSLDFLTASQRDRPERHHSLRVVFEHSWDLLSPEEQAVFARLSVFEGGFDLASAQVVGKATLQVLSALQDKSLIRRLSSGRFILHEVLKRFAVEKLAQPGSLQAETQAVHAHYFADWLAQQEAKIKGGGQAALKPEVQAEVPNLRQAWLWLVSRQEFSILGRLMPTLILYYDIYGPRREVLGFLLPLHQALEGPQAPPAEPDQAKLYALLLAAIRYFSDHSSERALSYQAESMRLATGLPDSQEKAYTMLLNLTGYGHLDPHQVPVFITQVMAMLQGLGDTWGVALAFTIQGDHFNAQSHPEMAAEAFNSGLAGFRNHHNLWGEALCQFGLAYAARKSGRVEEAYQRYRGCLDIYSQIGGIERALMVRLNMGEIAQELGRWEEARSLFATNQAYYASIGDKRGEEFYKTRINRLPGAQTSD